MNTPSPGWLCEGTWNTYVHSVSEVPTNWLNIWISPGQYKCPPSTSSDSSAWFTDHHTLTLSTPKIQGSHRQRSESLWSCHTFRGQQTEYGTLSRTSNRATVHIHTQLLWNAHTCVCVYTPTSWQSLCSRHRVHKDYLPQAGWWVHAPLSVPLHTVHVYCTCTWTQQLQKHMT